jgi:DNA mismatch repair ATPase MutS
LHYADLLEAIEQADWSAELLRALRGPVADRKLPSSKAIRQLRYAISQLDVRYNAFSALLEVASLWSVQWINRLEHWRRTHQDDLPAWFATLAEVDALVSFANYRMNQPGFIYPAINDTHSYFGSQLGHPLLAAKSRVTNDLEIATDGHIHLVTGSNMAGKSTWLRTVGVNVVLALAGAPVCAAEMRIPQLQVWTSMRSQDALHESTSSFFAELKRLKAIIEAVEAKDGQVFFLLDEILKGTNSRDRHTGARALIRQLIKAKGAGIIATHDLELATMENEVGSRVENYAMEVRIDEGELVFDYLLQRGVSQSFNATLLMARMGIKIDEQDIKLHHE